MDSIYELQLINYLKAGRVSISDADTQPSIATNRMW